MTVRELIAELQRDTSRLDTHIQSVIVGQLYTNEIRVTTSLPDKLVVYTVNPHGKPSRKGWRG